MTGVTWTEIITTKSFVTKSSKCGGLIFKVKWMLFTSVTSFNLSLLNPLGEKGRSSYSLEAPHNLEQICRSPATQHQWKDTMSRAAQAKQPSCTWQSWDESCMMQGERGQAAVSNRNSKLHWHTNKKVCLIWSMLYFDCVVTHSFSS